MATQLEIYNRAMASIGARASIASTAETSTEVLALNQHYDALSSELQEGYLWNFNRRVVELVEFKSHPGVTGGTGTGTEWGPTWPPPPWLYEYEVPADFLRARFVTPKTGATLVTSVSPVQTSDYFYVMNPPYRFVMSSDVDGADPIDVVLTDVAEAVLVYSADVPPAAWTAMFTQTVIFYLAARVAMQLAMDMEIVKLNIAQGEALLTRAKVADANQGMSPTISLPEWLKARGVSVADPDIGYLP